MGPRIFAGNSLAPSGQVWSYGLLTMMVVLAPSALDSAGGMAASGKFVDRLAMFAIATVYAMFAVRAFDALWPGQKKTR